MKLKLTLATALATFLLAGSAQAALISQGDIPQAGPGNGNPDGETSYLNDNYSEFGPYTFLAKFDYGKNLNQEDSNLASDGTWTNGAIDGASYFNVGDYSGDPAQTLLTWDLTGSGYLFTSLIVKTARSYYHLYSVDLDQQISDLVGQYASAPDGKDSISHITFFGTQSPDTPPSNVPDSSATTALLGCILLALPLLRRCFHK